MHKPPATVQVDGAAIRKRRTELDLTQDECARRAGVSRPYLSQLENGDRKRVRSPTYQRLCVALRLLLDPNPERQKEEPDAPPEGPPSPYAPG